MKNFVFLKLVLCPNIIAKENMQLKYIGTISSVKGLDGSVILSDIEKGIKTIEAGTQVFVGFSESFNEKYTVRKFHKLGFHSMISFNEITNPEDAEKLKEAGVFIDKEEITKTKDNVDTDELFGYKAFDAFSGELLGTVSDVWYLPAGEVWVIKGQDAEYTIPAVDEFIIDFDKRKKSFKVKLIEGMKNLNSEI